MQRESGIPTFTSDEFSALNRLCEFAENTLHHANETRGAVTIVRNMMRHARVVYHIRAPKSVDTELLAKLEVKEEGLKKLFPDLYSRVHDNTSPRGIVADDSDPETN